MVVMKGDTLPDVLLDNEMIAQLGIRIDPQKWTASFETKPYDLANSEVVEFPLFRPTAEQ